jgi:hypothetical protein
MEQHIKILGVLNIVWGAMGALGGLIVLLVFGSVFGIVGTAIHHDADAAIALPIIGLVGGAIALFLLLLSVPYRGHWVAQLQVLVAYPGHCSLGFSPAEPPVWHSTGNLRPLGAILAGKPEVLRTPPESRSKDSNCRVPMTTTKEIQPPPDALRKREKVVAPEISS